jgi:hypothetical protein
MCTMTRPLSGKRILIVSMTTWGEMGNWLSGKALAGALARLTRDAEVQIEAAETLIPRFAATGAAIKEATTASASPVERFARYSEVLRGLEVVLPPGIETAPHAYPPLAAELEPLRARLAANPPDLVIGTKGVICRTLAAALRLAGLDRPIVNYVTNHGHFQFSVHDCPDAALHLVRFPEGAEYLRLERGWPSESIRVIGYLIAAQQLGTIVGAETMESGEARSLIIVSNRGGREYLDVLNAMLPYGDSVDVTFIAINDEPLCEAAQEQISQARISNWRTVTKLAQAEFFQLLAQARSRGICALVSKASPNSIFEAAYFGLPMFLFRTGLPMEEWGSEIVNREGLGFVAETVAELNGNLTRAFAHPTELLEIRAKQVAFARQYLDQKETLCRIEAALGEVLAGRRVRGKAQ